MCDGGWTAVSKLTSFREMARELTRNYGPKRTPNHRSANTSAASDRSEAVTD